jgi:ring-1,2-phenylacetyl-CoA epoxidase subunit PaaE
VILDGTETNFKMPAGETALLDAAQQHGLDIPYSCKGGMCCTCKAHLDYGQVEMEVNYALEPGEIEAGFVLTCQAKPVSEKIVINYDKQH